MRNEKNAPSCEGAFCVPKSEFRVSCQGGDSLPCVYSAAYYAIFCIHASYFLNTFSRI